MRRVVAFNLAKVEENDARFFRGLRDAFTAHGADFKLFSPQSHKLLKDFRVPFDWVIRNIEKQYDLPPQDQVQRLPRERREIWVRRVEQLSLQGDGSSPEELVAILERFSAYVLERFNPDVILGWNTLCPHSGILCEIAKARGCKVYLLERAFLNNTWFLEKGGLVGHSEIVDRSFEELTGRDPDGFWEIGRSYLDTRPFDAMSRYVQNKNERFQELLAGKGSSGRPLIGFFPPDDLSLGFAPAGIEDQRKHIPSHDSSLDAAIALAQAAPDCDVVFKPHPSFRELDLPSQVGDNLFVIDHDYREVMAASDVVASTGSGLIVAAMAQGKPVLQLGRDQFSFKGITYDAQEEIRPALDAALQKVGLEERLRRFQTFIGYALSSYLVSSPSADVSFRRPVDAVRAVMRDCFGDLSPSDSIILSAPEQADDWVCRDRASLLEFLKDDRSDAYLVDFDHTLMFANSTELFLDNVRPKAIFTAVHWLLTWLVSWKSLANKGIHKHEIFDPLRILLCLLLAPWSALTWQLKAKRLARRHSNNVLLEHLNTLPPRKVIVVSNGHPWVLKPLLRAMGLGQAVLICGNILPGKTDIRRIGKLAACSRKIRGFTPEQTAIITDSADDADLLSNAGNAFLIDWDDHKTKADPLGSYFPFVLTDQGKYPGANVVKRHRFQEDFPVILAAYCLASAPPFIEMANMTSAAVLALAGGALLAALSCFLFFVSFNAVYELGYWENDFVAARKEAAPNVSPQMQKFQDYPLRPAAWIWAACLGALGAVCAGRKRRRTTAFWPSACTAQQQRSITIASGTAARHLALGTLGLAHSFQGP